TGPAAGAAVGLYGARHGPPLSPMVEEADAISDATAYAPVLGPSLMLAAWRGQEARASELIAATIEDAIADDESRARALADYALAVLCNGLGRYTDALAAAERACRHADSGLYVWALLELVEAGARSNSREVASRALCQPVDWVGAQGRDAALTDPDRS